MAILCRLLQVRGDPVIKGRPIPQATQESIQFMEQVIVHLVRVEEGEGGIESVHGGEILGILERDATIPIPVLGILFSFFESRWVEASRSTRKLQTMISVYNTLLRNSRLSLDLYRESLRNSILTCVVCHPLGSGGMIWIRKQAAYLLYIFLYRFPQDREILYAALIEGLDRHPKETRMGCLLGIASIGLLDRIDKDGITIKEIQEIKSLLNSET